MSLLLYNKMRFKLLLLLAFIALNFLTACTQKKEQPADREMNIFIDELMKKMTLDEKIGQLNLLPGGDIVTGKASSSDILEKIREGKVGALLNVSSVEKVREVQKVAVEQSRLNIPLIFGLDVIHGYRTIFPIPLGESCSWDLELMEKTSRASAEEASAEGINWTFAPMVDISRDPRWGRVMEGAGEDPWLGSQIAKVKVHGFQGDDLSKNNTILACVKHVAGYGSPVAGRDYNSVDMSLRTLYDIYLKPYNAAVDAGVASAMTAFNDLNGVPCTANHWLWEDLIRGQWGFNGMVVTDYTAINELINHGVAKNLYDASVLAVLAGIDVDMVSQGFLDNLKKAVEKGDVTEERINQSVYRVLKAKYKLGLFDDPYKYCDTLRKVEVIMTPEKVELARKAVRESCVLLKNQDVLPFRKSIKSIAVIGPLADAKKDMIGGWSAVGDRYFRPVTLLEGVKNKLGESVKIYYAKGTDYNSQSRDGFDEAIQAAIKSDAVLLVLGESYHMSAEAQSRSMIGLPGNQNDLVDAVLKANKNTAVILMNGRPLTIQHLEDTAPAILETWFAGTEAGNGIADVVFGDYNPSGKLTMSFPRNVGQVPIYYNHTNTGRPYDKSDFYTSKYIDVPNSPLYAFGYGLSYTTFEYGAVELDKNEISEGETINVSVTITNTGNFDGEEVVQLYIHDLVGSVARPVKELKSFKKIYLEKGKSKTVCFSVGKEDLSFYRKDMSYGTEPGDFEVFVGGDSVCKNSVRFVLK
jgi:beta-glucosidase